MRFKGQTLRTKHKQYIIREQLTEGGFSTIYTTNLPEIICKAQVLSVPAISQAYHKQKQILLKFQSHPNIVKLYDSLEMKIADNYYGFLMIENCSNGTAHTQLQSTQGNLTEKDILKIFTAVANVLGSLHKLGISHRDIKLQNVLKTDKGQYKVCDFGSSTTEVIANVNNNNRVQIQQFIEKTTTPFYRSPEQLDLYSGYEIGPKVDIFALGVLIFMLCFKKPPFESRLSAINKQYFIPDDCVYSSQLLNLLQRCWILNPKLRPTAIDIKHQLDILCKTKKALVEIDFDKQVQRTVDELSRVNPKSLQKSKEEKVEASFFDKIKLIYTQYTTQTEGWIRGFIEDNEEAPPLQYNRFIISKCWEKRYKVQKVYQIIWNYVEQNKSKSLVILKLLILIHNFLRKGPTEAVQYDKQYSPLRLATKIYKQWKYIEKPTSEQDAKRNVFLCLLIRYYCLVIIGKSKFAYENSDIFEGNYSIVPFFQKKHQVTLLKIPVIQSMLSFMQVCTNFHQIVQNKSYVLQIQRSIILSIVDEQYCLVSTFVFVYSAFKHGISHINQDLDLTKIQNKLRQIQDRFQKLYMKLAMLFEISQKFSSLFQSNTFLLNKNVINQLRNIKVTNNRIGDFKITQYLNYKDTIGGLKLPLTYEKVIKNPNFLKNLTNQENKNLNKQHIQIDQYKINKQKGQQLQTPSDSKKNIVISAKTDTIPNTYNLVSNQQKHNSTTSFQQFGMIGKPTNDQTKHRSIQNANFQKKQPVVHSQKRIPNDVQHYSTMQFTHQNLNRDFMANNNEITKASQLDKFKDFMSIVDMKVQEDKKKSKSQIKLGGSQVEIKSQPPNENHNSQNSNQTNKSKLQHNIVQQVDLINGPEITITPSYNPKPEVKKTEIVNFFEDDWDQQPVSQQTKTQTLHKRAQQEAKVSNSPPKKQPSIQPEFFKMEQLNKTAALPGNRISATKPEQRQVNSEKDIKSQDSSFIDLKGFIVEEVRRNAEQYLIDFKTLRFYEKVGNGHSSQVYKGEWRGREVAIKKIKDNLRSPNSEKEFRREIMTSVKIRNHPQLVTLIGVAQFKDEYYIINEFCYGLTLFDLLHESDASLPWKVRVSVAKQIARGMVFLHTNEPPIIHRDLKSLNVLLANKYQSGSHQVQIKIADFGLSRDFASTFMTGTLGTYHWMAPQIFNNESYSLKADVYSYGIVLWQIASRSPPYRNMLNPQALMKFVTIQNGRPDLTVLDPKTPLQIRMLMMRCWDRFPSNRPDFTEILMVLNSLNI